MCDLTFPGPTCLHFLVSLLNNIQSNVVNLDNAIHSVRNMYALSTYYNKTLDQVGCSEAFHHSIRRKADTGRNNIKDVQALVLYLLLT